MVTYCYCNVSGEVEALSRRSTLKEDPGGLFRRIPNFLDRGEK